MAWISASHDYCQNNWDFVEMLSRFSSQSANSHLYKDWAPLWPRHVVSRCQWQPTIDFDTYFKKGVLNPWKFERDFIDRVVAQNFWSLLLSVVLLRNSINSITNDENSSTIDRKFRIGLNWSPMQDWLPVRLDSTRVETNLSFG